MKKKLLTVSEIHEFVQNREVELVLVPGGNRADLQVHASYDSCGDFFTVLFYDVDYVCMPGGMEVTSIFSGDVESVARLCPLVRPLVGRYGGLTVLLVGEQGEDDGVIVAEQVEIIAGRDWPE